jgi:hypothetical protein
MLIRSQAKPAAISVIHACATDLPQVHAAPARAQVLLAARGCDADRALLELWLDDAVA